MKYIFIVVFAQIAFLIIGILIGFFARKTCLSKSCKALAIDIKRNLDTTVNPCADFYQFTCGKVVEGSGSKSEGVIKDATVAEMTRVFLLLLEGPRAGEPEAYTKAKKMFKVCTEDNAGKEEKRRRVRELFGEMGGAPMFQGEEWNENGWSWLETTRKIRERGLFCGSLFTLEAVPNPYDQKTSLGILDPAFPELEACAGNLKECWTLFNDTFLAAVLEFGVTKERAEEAAVGIYGLEMKLFELLMTHDSMELVQLALVEKSGRNLTNMTASFGYIDWPKFIGIMLQKDDVPNSYEVLVSNPGYMKGVQAIFQNTSNKVMANYMMWKVLQVSVVGSHLYPGNKTHADCFTFVMDTMGFVLSPMYLERYPDPRGNDLQVIVGMVDLLKDDILAAIQSADWMSELVKDRSTRKVLLLRQRIGDLKVLNRSFVEYYYRGLSVDGDAFEVMLSATKFNTDREFESCNRWSAIFSVLASMKEFMPNAFYFGMENSFNVLHSILQKPLFDPGWPLSVNYGRIGSIVGHEITHALDEKGHRYDEHGGLADTWDRQTYEQFNKTAQCLADQFNAFYNVSSPSKFSGAYKSVENMADTGGSRLAFLAYRKYRERMFWPDLELAGLDYSSDQLFFIGYALVWCDKAGADVDPGQETQDPHAPGRYRVLKTLRNNPHFAEVFGCQRDDAMMSGIECDVW